MFRKIFSVKKSLPAFLLTLPLLTAVLLANRAGGVAGNIAGTTHAQPAAAIQSPSESGRGQLVRIWIHGEDIYPSIVRVRPGRVLLVAENETQSDVDVVLERVLPDHARQNVARVSCAQKAKRADGEVTLGAGEYVFYEQTQPEVKGTLIVRPGR
jgi:hypothetical protein